MCFYSQFYDKSRVNCIFCFYIKLASAVIVIWKNVGKKFLLVQIDQCTKVQNEHFFSGGVGGGARHTNVENSFPLSLHKTSIPKPIYSN
jgi:hypothetical protein